VTLSFKEAGKRGKSAVELTENKNQRPEAEKKLISRKQEKKCLDKGRGTTAGR